MSFIEYEYWTIKDACKEDHDELIRKWFEFVKDHHENMFKEWKSARYYRQVDREGNPTDTYIMLFEYFSLEGHHAYKERRKNWDGPYKEYKEIDPYQCFNLDSVVTEYWEPQETDLWLDFGEDVGKNE